MRSVCLARVEQSLSAFSVRFKSSAVNELQESEYSPLKNWNEKPVGWDEAKPFESIPGPKPLPIIGNRHLTFVGELVGKDFFSIPIALNQKYGNICSLRNFFRNDNFLFLFTADHVKQMYLNEGLWPIRDSMESLNYYRQKVRNEWFGEHCGLASEHGRRWYEYRKTVNPIMMQPRAMNMYTPFLDDIANEFVERTKSLAKNHNNVMPNDFDEEIHRWSLESICLVAIDKRLGLLKDNITEDQKYFVKAMIELFDIFYRLDRQISFWRLFPTKDYRTFVKHCDFVSKMLKSFIDEAKNKIQESGAKASHDKSILEKLLEVDDRFAFITSTDMLLGGMDTTANTAGICLYHLAKNRRAQEELRKELKTLLPKKNSPITKEIVEKAKYLNAAIKESARISPIATGHLRRLTKDAVIAGYQIPNGTKIYSSNMFMSLRDYPRAKEYIPERWLRTTTGDLCHKNTDPITTLPFGHGPRSCVGKRIAQLELNVLIAKMIRNFRLEWNKPDLAFRQRFLYTFSEPLNLTVHELED